MALQEYGSPLLVDPVTGAIGVRAGALVLDGARGLVSVKDYGAKGDGISDDSGAMNTAFAAANRVFFPPGTYLAGAQLTMQAQQLIAGAGRKASKIKKGFNGDLFASFPNEAGLEDIYLDGDGGNFTGRLLPITSASDARQYAHRCVIKDAAGYCIEYSDKDAGSQSCFVDCEISRFNGTTAGNYAVKITDTQQLLAKPRKFFGIETNGTYFLDFGGSNNTYVVGCFTGGFRYTADTRFAAVIGTRIANISSMTVDGANNSLIGCDVLPTITIAATATNCTVGPGSFNTLPMVDLASNRLNLITHPATSYTPTLASAGTAPSLGNGTITGTYSREGARISYVIELTLGTTTTLGTGQLQFGLPVARSSVDVIEAGQSVMNRGGTLYTGIAQIPNNVAYVTVARDTSGYATATSPATFASGDTIRIAGAYSL